MLESCGIFEAAALCGAEVSGPYTWGMVLGVMVRMRTPGTEHIGCMMHIGDSIVGNWCTCIWCMWSGMQA